ncbi:MAG: hypothetical protein R6V30_02230 [Paracoccaceae bacterium]
MTKYHATMIDECGDEYGVTLDVDDNVENVAEHFREAFPESNLQFLEPAAGAQASRAQAEDVWNRLWDDDTVDLY